MSLSMLVMVVVVVAVVFDKQVLPSMAIKVEGFLDY